MTGSRVVPGVAALGRDGIEPLEGRDRPIGLQLAQQCTQRGAHDACAHEHYIRLRLYRVLIRHWRIDFLVISRARIRLLCYAE